MRRHFIWAVLIYIGILTCAAFAQDTANIAGTVTHPSGAFVPDAQVTFVQTATQFTRTVATGSNGEYVASSIPTGEYSVTVVKPGLEKLVRRGVILTAASTLAVDLQLAGGAKARPFR